MIKKLIPLGTVTAVLFCAGLFLATTSQAALVNIAGALTGTNHWYRTNIYQLNAMVFVRSNGVLNIEAGTVIKGHNTASFGTNVGALVICRGAKIFAEGTPQNPIIFTADIDDTTFPDDLDIYQRNLWGGLVILGQTVINGANFGAGNNATPKFEVYEGLLDIDIGGEHVLRFGGNDDNDSSGVLRYVSLRHGGAQLATDKEINGLSLGAVGRGTTIEFVEAYAFADDGFEFFGGTVNTKYLVSAFCDDDSFDTDMGFRGTNQFWFAVQPPDKRNYGMELNSQLNEIVTTSLLTPQADFKVYNMTIIGSGTGSTVVNGGRNAAVILRPYAAPKIYNSIFTDFNERGIELAVNQGVDASTSVTNDYAQFLNNLWWGFVTGSGSQNVNNTATNLGRLTVATNYWTDTSRSNLIVDPQLTSISRTNVGATLDPRPKAGSPALNPANIRATPNDGFLTPANYIGAFGPHDLWVANWTALAEYGVVTPAAQQVVNIAGALTGTNHWYRTNIYQLNAMVFVRSNGVLNIEAGTVIKGHNTASFGTNVGALVICRGAKIFAEGTPQNPIIFTADIDDTTFPDDLDIYQRNLWGGLVILGQTVINGANFGAGNNATPKFEVYEGLLDIDIGGEHVLRFGGNDDNDSSGVLRYVSLRHGGAQLATDKEINGLSLGAVGRGTTIEFVEAYAFADDGFEFFGGTVNTKYLVSAFCDDDSFDTDMGFRGTNQFWFAVQPPDKRNYGMELNSQLNEIVTTSLLTPQADFKVYNMTIIGSGTGSTVVNGGRNAAVILRPYAAPKIYNSIFTDFNERGIELAVNQGVDASTSVTNDYAQFLNNLWWGFVTGSGSQNVNNTATNLGRLTVATNYWTDTSRSNLIVDPQLTSISRTNVGATLDPRPKAGSPALNPANIRATPGHLTAANHIGAFGRVNWASDWTALGEYAVLTGAGAGTPSSSPAPVIPPTPDQPLLVQSTSGTNVLISFTSELSVSYQLQSAAVLGVPVSWSNEGSPVAGTGGTLTFAVPIVASSNLFLRVVVP